MFYVMMLRYLVVNIIVKRILDGQTIETNIL